MELYLIDCAPTTRHSSLDIDTTGAALREHCRRPIQWQNGTVTAPGCDSRCHGPIARARAHGEPAKPLVYFETTSIGAPKTLRDAHT